MSNPLFGICPVCGSDGGDYPASVLTGADSQSNIDTTQEGVPLVKYNGRVVCNTCKDRLISDEESRVSAGKHAEGERFRAKAGFVKTIT